MADIEIVVQIPEDDLDAIKYLKAKGWASRHELLILNGVQLPKGHGRLKDVDAIMRELSVVSSRPVKSQMYMIEQAPTIIEADKAESEGV